MCLAAIAIGIDARHPFVLASNRDEFFDRPAAALAWWRPPGATLDILGGRDLSAGGTWLGLTAAGRLALVTNVREPGHHVPAARSRGELVVQALQDPEATQAGSLAQVPRQGFNLFTATLTQPTPDAAGATMAAWTTNRPMQRRALGPGLYGLSNAALDTPWPKVTRLKSSLHAALRGASDVDELIASAFAALTDRRHAPDAELPATGIPIDRERQLSAAFIDIANAERPYGTRCSTVAVVTRKGGRCVAQVVERSFAAGGAVVGERVERWTLDPA
jgi:uncharacterized protein with NRDE domain